MIANKTPRRFIATSCVIYNIHKPTNEFRPLDDYNFRYGKFESCSIATIESQHKHTKQFKHSRGFFFWMCMQTVWTPVWFRQSGKNPLCVIVSIVFVTIHDI